MISALTIPAAGAPINNGFALPRRLVQVVSVDKSIVNQDVRLTFSDGVNSIWAFPTGGCLAALMEAAEVESVSELQGATLRVDAASLSSTRAPATRLTGWRPGPRLPVIVTNTLTFVGGLGNPIFGFPLPLDLDSAVRQLLDQLVNGPKVMLARVAPPFENDMAFVFLARSGVSALVRQLTPGALAVPPDQRGDKSERRPEVTIATLQWDNASQAPLTPVLAPVGSGEASLQVRSVTAAGAAGQGAGAGAGAGVDTAAGVGAGGGANNLHVTGGNSSSPQPSAHGLQRPIFTPASPATPVPLAFNTTSPTASVKSLIAAQSAASASASATAARASLAAAKRYKEAADASAAAAVAVAVAATAVALLPRPQTVAPSSQMSSPTGSSAQQFQAAAQPSAEAAASPTPAPVPAIALQHSTKKRARVYVGDEASSASSGMIIFPKLWLFSFAAAAASGPCQGRW